MIIKRAKFLYFEKVFQKHVLFADFAEGRAFPDGGATCRV